MAAEAPMNHKLTAAILALCASCALANPQEDEALAAPAAPASAVAGDPTEPEVNISEGPEGVVYEYRVRGRVYMVRIQPQVGPAYYLLDTNGDGILDVQSDSPTNAAVQQWVLYSW
jgi:hypothetical protein